MYSRTHMLLFLLLQTILIQQLAAITLWWSPSKNNDKHSTTSSRVLSETLRAVSSACKKRKFTFWCTHIKAVLLIHCLSRARKRGENFLGMSSSRLAWSWCEVLAIHYLLISATKYFSGDELLEVGLILMRNFSNSAYANFDPKSFSSNDEFELVWF